MLDRVLSSSRRTLALSLSCRRRRFRIGERTRFCSPRAPNLHVTRASPMHRASIPEFFNRQETVFSFRSLLHNCTTEVYILSDTYRNFGKFSSSSESDESKFDQYVFQFSLTNVVTCNFNSPWIKFLFVYVETEASEYFSDLSSK